MKLNIIVILFICIWRTVDSSRGDKDITFYRCMEQCVQKNCTGTEYNHQPVLLQLCGWDCNGECQYLCMWNTVGIFQAHGLPIPQFFGKEPASVIASLLNLAVHVSGILAFRKRISSRAPLFWFWHVFSIVCINGWVWSTVFHTRDTSLTEAMDYFSAFSMVTFSFFAAFVRMFEGQVLKQLVPGLLLSLMFANHVYYLAYVKFDYGYNMKANITIGILNGIFWMIWCWGNRKRSYVSKCRTFIVLALASVGLEVFDFPPIFWTIDSHALWHFSSALITPLWYSFLIDDCNYLQEETKLKIL